METSDRLPTILASTPKWLAVSKPAHWLSIPGRTSNQNIQVLSHWAAQQGARFIVHRLDLETSGVILFAKTAEAHREANQWFQNHEVKKAYHFLALQKLSSRPMNPMTKTNHPIAGQKAITQLEVQERYGECFLGRAVPLSGRRHQIRIHLSQSGYPILGDSLYGGPLEVRGVRVSRVALHASQLGLPTGEVFECPWPRDFTRWVEELRSHE